MKKILLATSVLAGLAFVSTVARADEPALQLGLGGYIAGYAVYTDQGSASGDSRREFDFRKDTVAELSGEVALDNGITAGAVITMTLDRADNGAGNDQSVEESYLYMSSEWGRINFGETDGAAFLLQVAAPSADENVDGIDQIIDTFAYDALTSAATAGGADLFGNLHYKMNPTGFANKLSYLTPVYNGFQGGVSFTPSVSNADVDALASAISDDDAGDFENAWELAARYEGSFEALDVAIGAGYAHLSTERDVAGTAAIGTDDRTVWNAGVNLGWNAFNFGVTYQNDTNGIQNAGDTDIWVAGIDYTTGPYTFGLSYLNRQDERNNAAALDAGFTNDIEFDRWTVGGIYEWGPGMTFRGAIAHVNADTDQAGDTERDATQVTLGTQLNF